MGLIPPAAASAHQWDGTSPAGGSPGALVPPPAGLVLIELEDGPDLPDGTEVQVEIRPTNGVRRGSPAAVLRLAGTLSDAEAEAIDQAARECRRIDPTLWEAGQAEGLPPDAARNVDHCLHEGTTR